MVPRVNIGNYPYAPYFVPDGFSITNLTDFQLGGIGLNDPTSGLQYQVWSLSVDNSVISSCKVYVSAPNTPKTLLFSSNNITWARLAFDQNMNPAISLVDFGGPKLYWFNPVTHQQEFLTLPSSVTTPCVTMDDKRPSQTLLGFNDVVLCYVSS